MTKDIIIASAATAALVAYVVLVRKHSPKRDAAANRVTPFGEFLLFTLLH
jgi:hypothetical protein